MWTCVTARCPSACGGGRAAAPTVAAVAHQYRLDAFVPRPAANQRQIETIRRVRPELSAQVSLGFDGAGEDDKAAGFIVNAVDGAAPRPGRPFFSLASKPGIRSAKVSGK